MDVFVVGAVPDAVTAAVSDHRQVSVERDVAAALDRLAASDPACLVLGRTPVPARTVVGRIRTHADTRIVALLDTAGDSAGYPSDVSVVPADEPARVATCVADAIAERDLDRLQRRHRRVRAAVEGVRERLASVDSQTALDEALVSLGDAPVYHAAWVLSARAGTSDDLRPVAAVGVPRATLADVSVHDDGAPARAFREGVLATEQDGDLTTVGVPVGDGVLVLVAPVESVPAGEREALTELASVAESVRAGGTDALTVLGDTLAHELANHLELAGTYLELAEERGDPGDFERVGDALRRIHRVADDARTLARDDLDLEPVDLATVAEAAWEESDEATLTVEDGALRADRGLLELCLENLFRNARAYGGADVTVSVEPTGQGFVVSDDGPGIPPERRDAVFDWGTGDGSGVGLGIVALVAERHGWSVELRESESGGAAFVVS